MKLISRDQTFIYYMCDQANGKSHGIRIGRAAGATGFVSETPTAQQEHPIRFTMNDHAVPLPVTEPLPPILANALVDLEDEHPEIHDLLTGRITFDDALRSH